MEKKVSIVIPCYNQGKYVQDALNSAINQTYKNIEIICVNDGSNDNSSEIIKNFVDKYKNIIFFDLKENKGLTSARNIAIDASTGEYILPLDADDIIENTYVEKAAAILDNNENIGIVYCNARKFGTVNEIWKLPEYNYDDFLIANCIFSCALFRKSDFIRAGKYKENMENNLEDWDLWLSMIELGLKPYKIPEILFNYRQCENAKTKLALSNPSLFSEIFKNHINLYLNNKALIEKIFSNDKTKIKKIAKYKKQRNLYFAICCFEFLILLLGLMCVAMK